MTSGQLVLVAVRLAGVFIGLQALVAAGEWLARYPSIAWHPATWGIYVLVVCWVLVAFLMVVWPTYAAGAIGEGRQSRFAIERSTVEGVGLRLLGVYLLVQAAAETAHIVVHQIVHQLYLSEVSPTWVTASSTDMISVASATVKTVAGGYLVMGTAQVQAAMRWTRTAGRDWELDDASGKE